MIYISFVKNNLKKYSCKLIFFLIKLLRKPSTSTNRETNIKKLNEIKVQRE